MRAADLKYISPIVGVSVEKVGRLLSTGMHHRVYDYGSSQVVKIPRKRFNFLYSKRSHLESDLELLHKYFPGLVVKTEVYSTSDHTRHCIVQEKVPKYELVTPTSMALVHDEMRSIVRANARLLREHRACLDVLGGDGFLSCLNAVFFADKQPYFSNMVIVRRRQKRRLLLLDSELIRLQPPQWKGDDIVRFFLSWAYFLTVIFWMKVTYGITLLKNGSAKRQ